MKEFKENLSQDAQQFIKRCLSLEKNRWSAEEAMESEFIKLVGNRLIEDLGRKMDQNG